jgi:catechol 2,3-dioxygenase-like lactoylglutathione lyase family enzyme
MAAMHPPMEVLSSRVILRPSDPARSRRFYRDTLGLAVYREFGPADSPGTVFFLGGGFLEVSGHPEGEPTTQDSSDSGNSGNSRNSRNSRDSRNMVLWLQVRDLAAEHERLLVAGADVVREPRREPWGLHEMWVEDPDGVRLVLVQVPDDHPLRRDQRVS